MGMFEDAIEEYKQAPPKVKIGLAVGVVAVAGIAIYMRSRSGSATSAASGQSSGLGNLQPTDASGGTATPPTKTPPPGQPTQVPPPPARNPGPPPKKLDRYTVQHGDNLSEIAHKLGIAGGWQAIYNQNQGVIGSNPNLIRPGEVLDLTGLR